MESSYAANGSGASARTASDSAAASSYLRVVERALGILQGGTGGRDRFLVGRLRRAHPREKPDAGAEQSGAEMDKPPHGASQLPSWGRAYTSPSAPHLFNCDTFSTILAHGPMISSPRA